MTPKELASWIAEIKKILPCLESSMVESGEEHLGQLIYVTMKQEYEARGHYEMRGFGEKRQYDIARAIADKVKQAGYRRATNE